MEDTDWRPSPCPICGEWREAARHPVCTNKNCGQPVIDTAAWNAAIRAAADAMLPTIIDFRGSWYEPALKAARGRILALLKQEVKS